MRRVRKDVDDNDDITNNYIIVLTIPSLNYIKTKIENCHRNKTPN